MFKKNPIYKKVKNFFSGTDRKEALLTNFYGILASQQYQPRVIFDVGANKGSWTKYCLNFFPHAQYLLFEPQPNLRPELERNLGNFSNVQIFSVGVGKTTGELLFTYHDRDDSCTFGMSEEEATRLGYQQKKMPVIDLDSFVKNEKLPIPDLLKIDAEGLDIDVLEGAKDLIRDHVSIVMVEAGIMNKQFNNSALEILKYMDQIGFRLFDITDLNRPFRNKVLWLCEFVFIKKGSELDKNYADF